MNRTELTVGLTLSTWMDGEGSCYPRVETVATGARVGVSTARRALAALEAGGWLARSPVRGRGRSRYYYARIPARQRAPKSESRPAGEDTRPLESGYPPASGRRSYQEVSTLKARPTAGTWGGLFDSLVAAGEDPDWAALIVEAARREHLKPHEVRGRLKELARAS